MENNDIETKRPSMLLWLVARITIITFPLAVMLYSILDTLWPNKNDMISFLACGILAFYATEWYESLNEEVTDYIRKKYP